MQDRRLCTILVLCVVVASLVLGGCATVPKEVVELSYLVGRDLNALHASYDKLIHDRYEDFRKQRMDYLENVWKSHYIRNWVADGKLIETAKGEVVWDEAEAGFVEVAATDRTKPANVTKQLNTVLDWADTAVYFIEQKTSQLIEPLNEEEKRLRDDVREAFARVVRGNAHITAHLNSLRKVHEVQDELLEALDIKDLRDRINNVLIKASQTAETGLEEIRKADGLVDESVEKLKLGTR